MEVLILVAVIAIGAFAFMGWRVGLVRRVVEFVGLIVSFLIASHFAPLAAPALSDRTGLHDNFALGAGWVVIFLLGLVATRMIAWIVSKTVRISILGWLDKLGGAVFGLLIGTLLISAILVGVSMIPGGDIVGKAFTERPVPRAIYQTAPALYVLIQRIGVDKKRLLEQLYDKAKEHTAAVHDAATSQDD